MMTAKERQEQWHRDGFDPHGFWKAVVDGEVARGVPWSCWFSKKKRAHESIGKRKR